MANPMFVLDEHMVELIFDYCHRRLALDPVSLDFGGARETFDDVLSGLIGETGNDPDAVLTLFTDHLAKAVISCDSPRFLSFIPAAPTKAALLFDMIVSCSSLAGTSWLEAAGAVAAENQVLGFLAELAGLPPGAGGCFVSGGSIANLSALVVARDTTQARRHAVPGRPRDRHQRGGPRLGGEGACGSWASSPSWCRRWTIGSRGTPCGRRWTVSTQTVRGTMSSGWSLRPGPRMRGSSTTSMGSAPVARQRGLWFHVDAAYGGAGLFTPLVRDRYAGIEHADSLVIDPHKWLYAPFDCAALVYREPSLARAVHSLKASYLDVIHDDDNPVWNPSDYAIHLTRRARGLPLWFSLAVHGAGAYRDAVETVLRTAWQSAELIRRSPHLELVRDPELSIVLFRRVGWGAADYDAWSVSLLASQIGFVTPTSWEGEPVARLAFLHPGTTLDMVEEILATMA